jgi:hypothetical protein
MRLSVPASAACLALVCCLAAAQNASMAGTWHLNVEKSKWGSANKPVSVVLTVEHNDPNIHYHGNVTYASEDERPFVFSGSFDGKPYPMSRSFGNGLITLTRLDPRTVESVFRTDDGAYTETARTTLSPDGRTLTRLLRVTSPEGTKKWTEVYEKR